MVPRTSPAPWRFWTGSCGGGYLTLPPLPLVALSGPFLLLPGPLPSSPPWGCPFMALPTEGAYCMCLPLLLLSLMKTKNDLTWAGLKCRAPVHPATPRSLELQGERTTGWAGEHFWPQWFLCPCGTAHLPPALDSTGDCRPSPVCLHLDLATWLFIWGRAGAGPLPVPISLIY